MNEPLYSLSLSVALPDEDRQKIETLVRELVELRTAARIALQEPAIRNTLASTVLWKALNRIETDDQGNVSRWGNFEQPDPAKRPRLVERERPSDE